SIWSQQSNMHGGIPSDCPHRERVGYTGDWGQVTGETAIFNFDMARFYTKWIDDMSDAQNGDTGFVPHSAPFEGGGGGPPWGSGYVVAPWLMYLYYGDRRVLRNHYAGMTRWVEYLKSRTDKDGIVTHEEPGSWDLGEWATPGKVEIPRNFVNTCYYAYVAQLMAKTAHALGKPKDVAYFSGLGRAAGNAVHQQFFDPEENQYWTGRQGANVFPLTFGLVPPEHKKAVFDRMVEIILTDNQGHFDTGIFGTRFVLDLLTANGRGDVAYTMMNQQTYPSFGWQIARGATTLWENWDGGFSHNHAMFGSVCHWFYKSLAGINPDPNQPGFKRVTIQPRPLGDLTYVDAKYRSMYGEIASSWTKSGDGFHLSLTIPTNSTATVVLPGTDTSRIQEAGKRVAKSAQVRILGPVRGRVACAVGSGHYEFQVNEPDES
ncbi:MAG: alpha-L-rhamnosidase C-terminal domain-containing protein, partial [Acidobacteriaceae bacterium]